MTECLTRMHCPGLASVSGRSCHSSTQQIIRPLHHQRCSIFKQKPRQRCAVRSQKLEDRQTESVPETDAGETTEKYGLEAGLFKVFTSKNSEGKSKGDQAKDLLARYGGAYLITSISFAIVSFAACYALVNAGVDVSSLLQRFGLEVNKTSETVGTAAIAYAAHKALSPVRFPPTVALTPIVARYLDRSKNGNKEKEASE